MANRRQQKKMHARVIKANVQKQMMSQDASEKYEAELSGIEGVVPAPYPIAELQKIVEISTILQQCIEAYKRNIVGFGAVPSYREDDVAQDETPEMKREWDTVDEFISFFNFDKSFEDVFAEAIDDRERTGNAFIEIIRDGRGLPVEGDRLDPKTMQVTKLFDERVPVEVYKNGKKFKRVRKFRKFVQTVGTKKVYFKELGDPRKMDCRNGQYVDSIEEQYEATEVLHLKIGSDTYGIPRWIGQLIHMYGARKAEELNFNYFTHGRHTPMAILLHNAILSPESEQALADYAASVEGVDNAHKFLLLEAEGLSEGMLDEDKLNAKVEIKSLAEMLQQDALFLEYDDASRQKVQSAFRLPDIYVGRSKDFNRATADTARYITEEQVFEPERNSLEWIINNRLLTYYELKETKMRFNKPEISDAEQVVKILDVAEKIGAVAPNDVRDVIGKYLGKDLENFDGEEFDLPSGVASFQRQQIAQQQQLELQQKINQPQQNVQKSLESEDLVLLMKDIRDLIEEQVEESQQSGDVL